MVKSLIYQPGVVMALALVSIVGCNRKADIEAVPLGSPVEVTRQDGGVVRGTLKERDAESVRMSVGKTSRTIPRKDITNVEVIDPASAPTLPPLAKFREYTVPSGTVLAVRLETELGSNTSHVGDAVTAVLTKTEVVDGVDLLPAGSVLHGVVDTAEPAGNVKGRASLGVRFKSITIAGTETPYRLSAGVHHTSAGTKSDDAKKIGIPAAGGAIIGAILGGKKGAVIGTVIGGGAGAVVVLSTSGPEVRYARGAALSLTLDDAIDVRVPIKR